MPNDAVVTSAAIPGGLIRFAVFVPFGIYYGDAADHWRNIRSHVELQAPNFSSHIARGEQLAAKWGKIGFYWNFAIWIPSVIFPPPFPLIFAAFDLTITTFLGMATHYQTHYSPHQFGTCRHGGAEVWQVPANGTDSFFTVAGALNKTKASSAKMCHDFVEEWQYGIALTILYAIMSACNVTACALVCASMTGDGARSRLSFKQRLLETVLAFPKIISGILFAICYIPIILFQCLLPLSVKAPIRYSIRYITKSLLRLPSPPQLKSKLSGPKQRTVKHQGPSNEGKPTPLSDFLLYDILLLIAHDLHYTDLLNLSLVSKSVHSAVLPFAADTASRLRHFKRYSCSPYTRTTCWICSSQICDECRHSASINNTYQTFHLDNCMPYCDGCYKSHVQRRGTGPRVSDKKCRCAPHRPPNRLLKIWNAIVPGGLATRVNTKPAVVRQICRLCYGGDLTTLQERRKGRTRRELKDPGRVVRCGRCDAGLASGPRWWVCRKCLKECCSGLHVSWGGDEIGDVEMVERIGVAL